MKNFILAGALLLYNYLFWQEKTGVNLPLFTLLLTIIMFTLNPEALRSRNAWITASGTLMTGFVIALHSSLLAKWMHFFSFFIMAGFIHRPAMRSAGYALINTVVNYFDAPSEFAIQLGKASEKNPSLNLAFRIGKLTVLPAIVLIVFYMIYFNANPVFQEYTRELLSSVWEVFADFFIYFSIWRILFLLLGVFLIAGVVYNREVAIFLKDDLSFSDKLKRIRGMRKKGIYSFPSHPGMIELKNENRSGIILLILVNLLLLVVNTIDITWIWFGFTVPENFSLKQFVHEGTYLLILSILLSMVILLYLFRGNQNFYQKSKPLQLLAHAWIAQNATLCISVLLRNYHYIAYHGLAFKRIGVILFLIMTFMGLVLLFLKIQKRLSFPYLIRNNLWSVYVVLMIGSLFNWSVIIARYNLNHWNTSQIDVDFYLDLSDSVLPLIHAGLPEIKKQIETHQDNREVWISYYTYENFKEALSYRVADFMDEHEKYSWKSWTREEEKAYRYFLAAKAKRW